MNEMTRIIAAPGPALFTATEFWRMVENGAFGDIPVELVEGSLHRMPPAGNHHSTTQVGLLLALAAVVDRALLRSELAIALDDDTVVGCDAAILRAPYDADGMMPAGNIALVVEVAVSSRDRDLGLKRRLYAAAGIPNFWVIDAERRLTHVFDRPERGDYLGLALVGFGEALAVPGAGEAIVIG
jgi:Uma2 family endonuclease